MRHFDDNFQAKRNMLVHTLALDFKVQVREKCRSMVIKVRMKRAILS